MRWISSYYMKGLLIFQVEEKISYSWIFKALLRQKENAMGIQGWNQLHYFRTKTIYKLMRSNDTLVNWYRILYGNNSKPQALFTLWLACHGKMATRSGLMQFGLVDYNTCCYCEHEEIIDHLLFWCHATRAMWKQVLDWIGIRHNPNPWNEELRWLIHNCNGKSVREEFHKLAIAETVYGVWEYRNCVTFGKAIDSAKVGDNIIDKIVYRGWGKLKLKAHISSQML